MPVVIGVFENAEKMQAALERLDEEGFGGEIVRDEMDESEGTPPRESDLGLAPGANQAGALDRIEPSSDLEVFDLTPDEREFLRLALDHGAEMVGVDTDRVDEVVAIFEEAGAQQVRDPR